MISSNMLPPGARRWSIVLSLMATVGVTSADQTAVAEGKDSRYELLIRQARVFDGTGRPEFRADIAVRGGRIAAVGNLTDAAADEVIDARMLALCPGFVDLHNHGDRGILQFRDAENYVRQGATTLVCGNCGSSPTDMPTFLRKLREGGAGVNIVMLIGHGSVRRAVLGDRNVAPNTEQLNEMRSIVRRALDAGAVGMSTGLRYRPGAWASTDEVLTLTKEIRPFGGFYATHMRDEGTKVLEAMQEALGIGRRAGVPVHISHHKTSSASVWGITRQTLARIDRARDGGMDVTLDQYPYGAGSSGISLMVPQATLSGGWEAFRKRMTDDAERERILEAVEELMIRKLYEADHQPQNEDATKLALSRIQLSRSPNNPALEGKTLTEILTSRETSITLRTGSELIVELVAQGVGAIYHTIEDRPGGDVDRVMQHPQTCISSDGGVFKFGRGHPHPRSYGTYPRLLARYVRQRKVLTWEQAIHKMTGLAARRLGWTDRGLIKPGYWADLVLLDPGKVGDQATFQKPHRYSVGVEHVIVRGEFVLQAGKLTGRRPGRPILSVPVANSPETRLRRELLDLLQRHDGRFALFAETADHNRSFSINAADTFQRIVPMGTVGPPVERDSPADSALTLRETVRRFSKSGRTELISSVIPKPGIRERLLFAQLTLADAEKLYLAVAYAAAEKNADEPLDLVLRQVKVRLRRYFDQSSE